MSDVKIVLNRSGVKELLRSPEMQQICKDHAYAAKSRLGPGYEVTYMVGKNRANARIEATTMGARIRNIRNNELLKALK